MEKPGWELGPEMAMVMAEPGDLILTDARFAHWPYSPSGAADGGACSGRAGLTFMHNTYLHKGFEAPTGMALPAPAPGN